MATGSRRPLMLVGGIAAAVTAVAVVVAWYRRNRGQYPSTRNAAGTPPRSDGVATAQGVTAEEAVNLAKGSHAGGRRVGEVESQTAAAAAAATDDDNQRNGDTAELAVVRDYPINVGPLTVKVDTSSADAQAWFDRGLAMTANFQREEAAFCFTRACDADPDCAMARWGVALVHGPDYNFHAGTGFYGLAKQASGHPSLLVANTAAATARALAAKKQWTGPRMAAQRELIEALVSRYEWPLTDTTPELQARYRDAVCLVGKRYPNDPLVAACEAEAIMCLAPWALCVICLRACVVCVCVCVLSLIHI